MLTIKDIQITVAEEYGLTLVELRGCRRSRFISQPRMIAMWLSTELLDKTLPQIGKAFNKDHTTVLNARRRWKSVVGNDFKHCQAVKRILQSLRVKAGLNETSFS